ncbi:hypothetical protein BJY04DRAFT_224685 [Aspergillus karnatakaensis]|uniref:uncharacterized protein n=1 Tax=Aspergillus karnatakaensis TaxID=1810916 RepID=UPI003CCD320B
MVELLKSESQEHYGSRNGIHESSTGLGLTEDNQSFGRITVHKKRILNAHGNTVNFRGEMVKMSQDVPQETGPSNISSIASSVLRDAIREIQTLSDHQPVLMLKCITNALVLTDMAVIETALPLCGYMFTEGPWEMASIKFGVDPRIKSEFRFYQTITFDMETGAIVKRGEHGWVEKDVTFPQPARKDNDIPHIFNGRTFRSDDLSWQLCDIEDALLRGIFLTSETRLGVHQTDGFFWNGTMAKLKVIMRHKLICIRNGLTPNDEDYKCLLAFPDNYEPPVGRDYYRYGLKFGQQYDQKQAYLRHRIVEMARRSSRATKASINSDEHPSGDDSFLQQLAQAEIAIIDSIGNKKLTDRLYKRTLRIFSREERLDAIEFYRTHVHIDSLTGEERNLSISSASEYLCIHEATLTRWIREERRIKAMSKGSSRDDGNRYSAVNLSERFKSGHYPFLKLTPEQLCAKKYVHGKDLYKLHPITHPVPFIGIEGGRRGKLKSFADAYRYVGQPANTLHPGHPTGPIAKPETKEDARRACLGTGRNPVQQVNAKLYELAPDYNLRQLGRRKRTPCYAVLSKCVNLICEQLIAASSKLESAVPIRIGFDYDIPFQGAPQQWAIVLVLKSEVEILLPLSLCLRGSVRHEVIPDTLVLQGWTTDYEIMKCKPRKRQRDEERERAIKLSQIFYEASQSIFEALRLSPVLYIEDVELLFLRSESWRPRRFSPVWTLYSTILHSSYRSGSTWTPIYGQYTDVGGLVDAIIVKAPRVSFNVPALQPFQLVPLGHFVLSHKIFERAIVSQFADHLEVTGEFSRSSLKLELVEKALGQDARTAHDREFRAKLVQAIKLSIRKSQELVNNRARCLYYACPEPQQGLSSYYCHHHSTSLINYVMDTSNSLGPADNLGPSREVCITDETRKSLQHLKALYARPEKTWILDFEYVSMPKRYSPIPLQLAITQLDGKLLYSSKIDYGLSIREFLDATSPYVSDTYGMVGTSFLRCYDALETNGDTPFQARDQITRGCGYNASDVQILSWYSAQDMQCFLRVLAGGIDVIQDKFSHEGHENFQSIHIGHLCSKLFPGLLSTTLRSVHEFIGNGEISGGHYHDASYDTGAMAAIIKALVDLI